MDGEWHTYETQHLLFNIVRHCENSPRLMSPDKDTSFLDDNARTCQMHKCLVNIGKTGDNGDASASVLIHQTRLSRLNAVKH